MPLIVISSNQKAEDLYAEAKTVMRTDFQLARERGQKCLSFSSESKNELYEMKSLFLLAWLEKKMLNYRRSSDIYFQIILKQPSLELEESKKIVLSAYKNLGYLVSDYNDFELASILNKEAFLLASRDLKDTSLMLKYLRPQLSIYIGNSDYFHCLNLANHIISNYTIKDGYFKNEINFFIGMSHQNLGNVELATILYDEILKDSTSDDKMVAKISHQTGLIYISQQRYIEAIETLKMAAVKNEINNSYTSLFINYDALAESYTALEDYAEAIKYYELMVNMSKQQNINNNLKFETIPKLIKVMKLANDLDEIDRYQEEYRLMMEDYYTTKKVMNAANEATDVAIMKTKMKELIRDRQNQESQNAGFSTEISIGFLLLILSIGLYYFNNTRRKIAIINDLKKIGIESNI